MNNDGPYAKLDNEQFLEKFNLQICSHLYS